jgi:uncharacterized phage protein (TIGR02220 family)
MMIELDPAERYVWFGFLLLAGDCAHEGLICATENSGYTDNQLAELLKADVVLVKAAKRKFLKYGKIEIDESGIIKIVKWHLYQSEYLRQKSYRVKLQDGVTNSSPSISISLLNEILKYLNEKTGKNFGPENKETQRLILGRINEGRTVEDFKKVIDTKVQKWANDPKMADFLRPSTLFRPSNFEAYLNERPAALPKSPTDKTREWAQREMEKEAAKKGTA